MAQQRTLERRPEPAPRYGDRCPVARVLTIIGERWTILILRDLLKEGPRKFGDLERSLSGISPNTLSSRLKTLEDHGIIATRFYEDHPPRAEYVLTGKGEELRPVLRSLREWGQKHTG
jgi:DNA-binding HxlR family transcriptional regulator